MSRFKRLVQGTFQSSSDNVHVFSCWNVILGRAFACVEQEMDVAVNVCLHFVLSQWLTGLLLQTCMPLVVVQHHLWKQLKLLVWANIDDDRSWFRSFFRDQQLYQITIFDCVSVPDLPANKCPLKYFMFEQADCVKQLSSCAVVIGFFGLTCQFDLWQHNNESNVSDDRHCSRGCIDKANSCLAGGLCITISCCLLCWLRRAKISINKVTYPNWRCNLSGCDWATNSVKRQLYMNVWFGLHPYECKILQIHLPCENFLVIIDAW